MSELTPGLVLRAYANGYFPMADSAESPELFWFDPPLRGILPLDGFRVPKRLRRTVRQGRFQVRYDTAFEEVITACAEPTAERPKTWINQEIVRLYCELAALGHAHSVECWREGRLAGGLYGVALRGAFFGESMFSRETDASKVALVHLVALLRHGGFTLLDSQFMTGHLRRFGGIEVTKPAYKTLLVRALATDARLDPAADAAAVAALLAEQSGRGDRQDGEAVDE